MPFDGVSFGCPGEHCLPSRILLASIRDPECPHKLDALNEHQVAGRTERGNKAKKMMDQLKVGTGWIDIEVVSEPYVVLTFKGYVPAVTVRILSNGLDKRFFVSAKSLSHALEPLRNLNGEVFKGLKLRVAKEDDSPMAAYKVEKIET